jgi:flagellin-like protein
LFPAEGFKYRPPAIGPLRREETVGDRRRHRMRARAARRRGGVSPIIASILLVAVVVVLAGVLYVLISGYTRPNQTMPGLPENFLLAPPIATVVGAGHWYNFTVQLASGGLVYQDLGFQLRDANGAIIKLPATASITVVNGFGAPVASYNWTSTLWSSGGTLTVNDLQRICLFSGSTALSGSQFNSVAVAVFSGSVSTAIP